MQSECRRNVAEVALVEGDDGVGATVHRGFQHHLIGRVAQLGPPDEMREHGFDQGEHTVDEGLDVGVLEAGGEGVLGSAANCFVLQRQRDIGEQRRVAREGKLDQGRRSAAWAAQRCNDHVAIQDESHGCIVTSPAMSRNSGWRNRSWGKSAAAVGGSATAASSSRCDVHAALDRLESGAQFGKIVGACEAELEGFAHDLRELAPEAAP